MNCQVKVGDRQCKRPVKFVLRKRAETARVCVQHYKAKFTDWAVVGVKS